MADNEHAIRSHQRVGFKRVGVQQKSELAGHDASRDGLLMDLLAEELE